MNINSDFLLEGATLSLEQCGRLLFDSVNLYESESYASAVVLAAFAREELGKCIIYYEMQKTAERENTEIKLAELINLNKKRHNEELFSHVNRQRKSMLSTTMSTERGTPSGDAIHTSIIALPNSPEWMAARLLLDKETDKIRAGLPQSRSDERKSVLYVDLGDSGWSAPKHKDKQSSHIFVQDAMNDYVTFHHSMFYHHPALSKYIKENAEKFIFPNPRWPDMSPDVKCPTLPFQWS